MAVPRLLLFGGDGLHHCLLKLVGGDGLWLFRLLMENTIE